MVKKTKKEREKAKAKAKRKAKAKSKAMYEIKCRACNWEGHAVQLIWNGRQNAHECPNCTGSDIDYDMSRSEERVEIVRASDTQVYCRRCHWEGEPQNLVTDPATAKDACPLCWSLEISYISSGTDNFLPPPRNKNKSKKTPDFKNTPSCYENHPPLSLGKYGEIYGGSCLHPVRTDLDIYIGLDYGMNYTDRSFPWTYGEEFLYAINDGSTPTKKENFKNLVIWVAGQIDQDKSVHVGCIGGHGRTGMFLAALVAYLEVDPDPIAYVRKNYCHKAVESLAQTDFLREEYGCPKAKGSKAGAYSSGSSKGPYGTIASDKLLTSTAFGKL